MCATFQVSPPVPYLDDSTEVAVGGELQALLLGPGLDVAELLSEDGAPVVTAQPRVRVRHQLVEQPHVDEVEELREELDGQGGVDPTPPQQRHRPRQRVQDVLWKTTCPLMFHKSKNRCACVKTIDIWSMLSSRIWILNSWFHRGSQSFKRESDASVGQ